jgi:hypothetical protein
MQDRPSLRSGLVGIVGDVVPRCRRQRLRLFKRSDPTITTKNAVGILILQVLKSKQKDDTTLTSSPATPEDGGQEEEYSGQDADKTDEPNK